jgi:hypothetical protein
MLISASDDHGRSNTFITYCLGVLHSWILQPEYEEASDDRKTALYCHVKPRKQYHSSSLSSIQNSYTLGDKNESS